MLVPLNFFEDEVCRQWYSFEKDKGYCSSPWKKTHCCKAVNNKPVTDAEQHFIARHGKVGGVYLVPDPGRVCVTYSRGVGKKTNPGWLSWLACTATLTHICSMTPRGLLFARWSTDVYNVCCCPCGLANMLYVVHLQLLVNIFKHNIALNKHSCFGVFYHQQNQVFQQPNLQMFAYLFPSFALHISKQITLR